MIVMQRIGFFMFLFEVQNFGVLKLGKKRKPYKKIGAFVKRDPTKPRAFVFHETKDRIIDYDFPEPEPVSYAHEVPRSTYVKPRNLTSEHQMHRDHEKNARVAKLLEGNLFLDSTYLLIVFPLKRVSRLRFAALQTRKASKRY